MTHIICRALTCLFWEQGACSSEEIEYEPDVGCLTFQDIGDLLSDEEDEELEWEEEAESPYEEEEEEWEEQDEWEDTDDLEI